MRLIIIHHDGPGGRTSCAKRSKEAEILKRKLVIFGSRLRHWAIVPKPRSPRVLMASNGQKGGIQSGAPSPAMGPKGGRPLLS